MPESAEERAKRIEDLQAQRAAQEPGIRPQWRESGGGLAEGISDVPDAPPQDEIPSWFSGETSADLKTRAPAPPDTGGYSPYSGPVGPDGKSQRPVDWTGYPEQPAQQQAAPQPPTHLTYGRGGAYQPVEPIREPQAFVGPPEPQQQGPLANQHMQQLAQAGQALQAAQLSPAENIRSQRLRQAQAQVQADVDSGLIDPGTALNIMRQIGTMGEPLWIRQSQAPLLAMHYQFLQMQHEAAQQQAIQLHSQEVRAGRAQLRTMNTTLPDGRVISAIEDLSGRMHFMPDPPDHTAQESARQDTHIDQLEHQHNTLAHQITQQVQRDYDHYMAPRRVGGANPESETEYEARRNQSWPTTSMPGQNLGPVATRTMRLLNEHYAASGTTNPMERIRAHRQMRATTPSGSDAERGMQRVVNAFGGPDAFGPGPGGTGGQSAPGGAQGGQPTANPVQQNFQTLRTAVANRVQRGLPADQRAMHNIDQMEALLAAHPNIRNLPATDPNRRLWDALSSYVEGVLNAAPTPRPAPASGQGGQGLPASGHADPSLR